MFRIYQLKAGEKGYKLLYNSDIGDDNITLSDITFSSSGVGDMSLSFKSGYGHLLKDTIAFRDTIVIVKNGTIEKTMPAFVGVIARESINYGEGGLVRTFDLVPNTFVLTKFFTDKDAKINDASLEFYHGIRVQIGNVNATNLGAEFFDSLKNVSITEYVNKLSEITGKEIKTYYFYLDTGVLITSVRLEASENTTEIKRQQIRKTLTTRNFSDLKITTDSSDFINSFRLNDVEVYSDGFSNYDGKLEEVKIDDRFSVEDNMRKYAESILKKRVKKRSVSFTQVIYQDGTFDVSNVPLEVGNGFTILLYEKYYRCVVTKVTYNLFDESKRQIEATITSIE